MTIGKINPVLSQLPSAHWKPSCSRPARVDGESATDSFVLGKGTSPTLALMLSREAEGRQKRVRPETTERWPYLPYSWDALRGYASDRAALETACLGAWRKFWASGRADAGLPIGLLLCGEPGDCTYDLSVAFNNALRAVAVEGLRQQSVERSVPIYTLECKHVFDHDVTSIRELVRSVFKKAQCEPAAVIHVDVFNTDDEHDRYQTVTEALFEQVQEELAQVHESPQLAICATISSVSKTQLDFSDFVRHHLHPLGVNEVASIVQGYVNVEDGAALADLAARAIRRGMKRRNIRMMSNRAADIARAHLEAQNVHIPLLTKVSAVAQDLLAAFADQEAFMRDERGTVKK